MASRSTLGGVLVFCRSIAGSRLQRSQALSHEMAYWSVRRRLSNQLESLADRYGTPTFAGGVVINTDNHAAYGNMVDIDHGSGLVTRYAHASKLLVKTGDLVKRGQVVALVGNTGRSTGPHLHFEVLVDSVPQNPARFLAGRGGDAKSVAGNPRGR